MNTRNALILVALLALGYLAWQIGSGAINLARFHASQNDYTQYYQN